ncbi:MAG: phage terminase large subunit family protein, partial [Candidatus Poseidoniaceae archaeon]|nr:phage terminase large subunit family protein [Candidatus Poseidoniaceae archaeon]
ALQVPLLPMSPTGLGPGEVRMNEERRVECPSCDSRLGLPRGSEPPFRFTCPKCDSSIRVVP